MDKFMVRRKKGEEEEEEEDKNKNNNNNKKRSKNNKSPKLCLGDLTMSPNNTYEKGINSLQNLGYPYLVGTSNTLNHIILY
jgi:hypothetical protein